MCRVPLKFLEAGFCNIILYLCGYFPRTNYSKATDGWVYHPDIPTSLLPYFRGLYIGKYPPPRGGKISADVIWGKKYEKAKRKRGKK
jgi:hypothetical protein